MRGGKAYGRDRQYQVACRDVLMFREPSLKPWAGDGIDVPFDLDTRWTLDVALCNGDGALVLVECKRTTASVKQGAVAEFAHKVEWARKILNRPVAGILFTTRAHQLGAIRAGEFNGIQIAVLAEGSAPPGLNITFLHYDPERERRLREIIMHVAPGSFTLSGGAANLIYGTSSDKPNIS